MRKSISFPTIAIIAVFAVVLVIFCVFWGQTASLPSTIPELPPTMSGNSGAEGNTENIDFSKISITPQNVQSVIAALKRPDEYYVESISELFYNGGSTKYLRRKWVQKNIQRIDVFSGDAVTMHVVFGQKKAFYWRPGDTNFFETPIGNFTADEAQMMMVYEDILKLKLDYIISAMLSRYNGEDCIYVEVQDPELTYLERYWVSTKSGVLVLGQILKNSKIIYTVQTQKLNIAPQPDSVFLLPGNISPTEVDK